MSGLTVLVPEFVVTKSLPENSLIIGSEIESNRKRKAGENNRGGKYSGGGNTQYYAVLALLLGYWGTGAGGVLGRGMPRKAKLCR